MSHKYQMIEELGSISHPIHSTPSTRRCVLGVQFLTNILIFGFGLFGGYMLNRLLQESGNETKHLIPSPANEAIDGEPLILSPQHGGYSHNPFKGFPTPQTDVAWRELMNGYAIRVPQASVDAVDLNSIPLNDGSGDVWVSMNIYHHLHCLDSIRHQVAGIGCKTPKGEVGDDYFPPHIDHCIETLRRRLLCQPDLGIRALAWHPEMGVDAVKANNTVNSECVNWNAIQDWTRQHTFAAADELITQPDGKIYNGPWTPPPRCGV